MRKCRQSSVLPTQLEEGLGRRIERLRRSLHRFLIVEVGPADVSGHRPYYLQLMFDHDRIYAEAVSNEFLDGPDVLDPRRESRLVELGWAVPGSPCHPACTRQHPNFWRLWDGSTPTADIVSDLLRTIVQVYLRSEGDGLSVHEGRRATAPSLSGPVAH